MARCVCGYPLLYCDGSCPRCGRRVPRCRVCGAILTRAGHCPCFCATPKRKKRPPPLARLARRLDRALTAALFAPRMRLRPYTPHFGTVYVRVPLFIVPREEAPWAHKNVQQESAGD